ncbi:glycosyltransferase family 2 protein [Rhizobium sp. LjRoot254]|uniref:glycosyltransferase family 2 protein n=1 Tax=Rhizobium sp. LjRoot254 TaxID=3342297 RepID=UPI003ED03657
MAELIEEPFGEPLVSIIIPAYNAAAFIVRTLDSVQAQTHASLEIIVVDDGSTDNTRDLVLKVAIADARVRVISTANQGVAAARNKGVAEAAGSYIAFVDADDLWHPSKIQKQLALLRSLPEDWCGVYTLYHFIDLEDRIIGRGGSRAPGGYIYARHMSYKFIGNGSTLLLRREAIDSVGGYDPGYAAAKIGGCEDLDYELRLFARYKVAAVAERLVGYRMYDGNMSSDHSRMARSMTEAVERGIRLGPALSDYAKVSARAFVLGYKMIQMLISRRFGAAARCALTLTVQAPLVLLYRLASYAKLVSVKRRKRKQASAPGPLFRDMAAEPVPPPREQFWDRRRMRLLGEEDARLEASLFSHYASDR